MNEYEGTLISIEGTDGVGKGTAIDRIKEEFPEFEYTYEPSEGKYGRITREELQSDSDPTVSDFFLFCADRYDHCHSLIGPKLENGNTVLTDRYHLSTFAYQSPVIRDNTYVDNPYDYIDDVLSQFIIYPDLTILIDAPVKETLHRLDDDKEKYEKISSLREARRTYNYFANRLPYVERVDGMQSKESVARDCIELIENEV